MERVESNGNTINGKYYSHQILEKLKDNVQCCHEYFKDNYDRFNRFQKFVFDTNLDSTDVSILNEQGKPALEFNICEAFISRLLGEFANQEPSVTVSLEDGAKVDPKIVEIVEDHLRYILFDANKNGCESEVYKEQISGGFSVMEVYTEYSHEMSFNQNICLRKAYDPTLCGFDPLAVNPTKSDGRFCFKIYPKSKEDFQEEYPDEDISNLNFTRDLSGFQWAYENDASQKEILLICEYYEKKKKRIKIVQLVTGDVVRYDEYKKKLEIWEDSGLIAQPPGIMGRPRWTHITTICRYIFIKDRILSYEETDYKMFPLVYVPGNDVLLKDEDCSSIQVMTRPYIYHMEGAQKLKNYAGQTWANELENMVQHKWMAAQESIPDQEDLLTAWKNPQKSKVLVYNAFDPDQPEKALPIPSPVPRVPMPQEVVAAFSGMDQLAQVILGNFSPEGMKNQNLSGDSIVEAASQSNAAAMPYIIGFLQGLNQVAQIIVDLIPKYYTLPRTIPLYNMKNEKTSLPINDPNARNSVKLNYGDNALKVKVEAGVNFSVQKSKALNQLIGLMRASPTFANFMNSEGLPVLLDNLEIRGIDQLKLAVEGFLQQMKQQQAQAQQNNPEMLKLKLKEKEMALNSHHEMIDDQLEVAKLSIQKQDSDTRQLEAEVKFGNMSNQADIARMKAEAESSRTAVELATALIDKDMKMRDMAHTHAKNIAHHLHEKEKYKKEMEIADNNINESSIPNESEDENNLTNEEV